MSVTLRLPNFNKVVSKDKELSIDDIKGYVCVRKHHAIIASEKVVLVFNLKDYFTNYYDIKPDEREALIELLDWMNNKNFSAGFWEEIAGLNTISVVPEDPNRLSVESGKYVKEIIYSHQNVLIEGVYKLLNYNAKTKAVNQTSSAFHKLSFDFIFTAVKGFVRNNKSIVIEFLPKDKPSRFTFQESPFVFGVIYFDSETHDEPFHFDSFKDFSDDLVI